MLECSNGCLQVCKKVNQEGTSTFKSKMAAHKCHYPFHSLLNFRLSCCVHINKNTTNTSEENQAGSCFNASISFPNSSCKMLKFYNTQHKSNFTVTASCSHNLHHPKMLSQRTLLIWTQYKFEPTIFNNFYSKIVTVTVYIK